MTFSLLSPDHHELHTGADDVSMTPFVYVQLAILVVATVLEIAVFVRTQQQRVNAFAFASQLRKLVDAKNLERAIKLCNAAPDAWASRLARIGIEAHGRSASMRDAMRAQLPALVAGARSFLLPTAAIGAVASVEGLVLLVRTEGHASGTFDVEVAAPLLLLMLFTALNVARWVQWQGELDLVVETLAG